MAFSPHPPDHRAYLEQILEAEQECARLVQAAQESMEPRIAQAHSRAAQIKQVAVTQGQQQGEAELKAILEQAHMTAQHGIALAQQRANALLTTSDTQLKPIVAHVIALIVKAHANDR